MNEAAATPHGLAEALGMGLPNLLLQFVICLALLIAGVAIYTLVTPFRERELVREGNVAAATLLSGAIVALAIPLAALLATTSSYLEIVVWGAVAIVLQLVTVVIISHLMRGMMRMIAQGQVAAALPIAAMQIAVGLLNAAVMVPVW
jgi:putative membrane protein